MFEVATGNRQEDRTVPALAVRRRRGRV